MGKICILCSEPGRLYRKTHKNLKMEWLNDDLDVLDIIENGFPRRRYQRANYIDDMDDYTFFKRFRLMKPTVEEVLLPQIENILDVNDVRGTTISPLNQLLTTLRFYATGGHLSSIADFMGMNESTASKIVKRTSQALASLRPIYIRMPQNQAETNKIQSNFYQIASFPRVIGCIDCTHIRIQSPGGEDGEVFRNRKGYYSINVQLIADASLQIRDIVARWPGSQHDSTIFNHSRIKNRFVNREFPNCILLGDSGYALNNYLLTPLLDPRGRGQTLYNEAHIRTRNTIERTNGVIKRRFPVLAYGIRLKLDTTLTVIVAAAVLHNIAISANEPEPPLDIDMNLEEINYLIEMGNIPNQPMPAEAPNFGHFTYRDEIINYFQNLP